MAHFTVDISAVAAKIIAATEFAGEPSPLYAIYGARYKPSPEPHSFCMDFGGNTAGGGNLTLYEKRSAPLEYSEEFQKQGSGKYHSGRAPGAGVYLYPVMQALLGEFPHCCGVALLSGFSSFYGVDRLANIPRLFLSVVAEYLIACNYTYCLLITTDRGFAWIENALKHESFKGHIKALSADTSRRTDRNLRLTKLDAFQYKPPSERKEK